MGKIGTQMWVDGDRRDDLRLRVRMRSGATLLAADTYQVVCGEVHRGVVLSDPGIDDSRNELLWNPHAPKLIDVELDLTTHAGELLDRVRSYTALRSATVQGDRFLLNGRPYTLRLVLDQGYWHGYSVRQVIDTASRVTGRRIPVRIAPRRPGDPAVLVASSARIRRDLGWQPRFAQLEALVDSGWH